MSNSPLGVLPPFPEGAFTGDFALYRALMGPTTESPDQFGWGALASFLSALVGRDAGREWGGKDLFPNLNIGLLGDTALSRKSTSLDDCRELLEPLRPRPSVPGEPARFTVLDGTGSGEGLITAIADQPWINGATGAQEIAQGRRVVLTVHELAELLGKAKRDQAGNLVEMLLSSFDARSSFSHFTKKNSVTVTGGLIVVCAATTVPTFLGVLASSSVSSGLLNRFQWLAGDRKAPLPLRPRPDAALTKVFLSSVAQHVAMVRGHTFSVSPEAKALHDEHYNQHYFRKGISELALAGASRADIIALKNAMLIATANGSLTITAEMMATAWAVADYGKAVVARLVERMPQRTPREAEERMVACAQRYSAERGPFTCRDLMQRMKSRTFDHSTGAKLFRGLVEAGTFVQVTDQRFDVTTDHGDDEPSAELPLGANGPAPAPVATFAAQSSLGPARFEIPPSAYAPVQVPEYLAKILNSGNPGPAPAASPPIPIGLQGGGYVPYRPPEK